MTTVYHDFIISVASAFGLTRLEENAPIILAGFVTFVSVHLLSPLILSSWFPTHYKKLSSRTKKAAAVHLVAFVHALYSAPAAVYLIRHREQQPGLVAQPLVGYDPLIAKIGAFSTGYFAWDALVSTLNIGGSGGIGFILHGVGCFIAFVNAQRPFALYFLPYFLAWEISSIPLNIHWALDKVGKTGSRFQLINGVILLATFFCVRIVIGYYSSVQFFAATSKAAVRMSTPGWVVNGYRIANVVLNGLNTYWFVQMIKSVKKRFDAPPPSGEKGKKRA